MLKDDETLFKPYTHLSKSVCTFNEQVRVDLEKFDRVTKPDTTA